MRTRAMSPDELASEVRDAYEELSPLIEALTSEVCPDCESVCCIDRHGTHECADLVYLGLLSGVDGEGVVPPEPALVDDTLPCRHLGERGCGIARWRRPHRCTWYFCERLLDRLRQEDSRQYRKFVGMLGRLCAMRHELVGQGE